MEQNCGNCQHYARHYIKCDARIRPIHCRHCMNPSRHGVYSKKTADTCNYWQDKEAVKQYARESIVKTIQNMHTQLWEISAILNDDE